MKLLILALAVIASLMYAYKDEVVPLAHHTFLQMLTDNPDNPIDPANPTGFSEEQCEWYFGPPFTQKKRCERGGWFNCNSAFVNCCRHLRVYCDPTLPA
ncbi:unnamed protein product [Moneuplotes crassus]|uniref:Uncharacterized protein n=1 Tax=Euplotes crassus TaxID=5936 RepID=A0AAD1XWE2_EUPCR|nr:unnamed protein product [Moneuplotes crassus]